MRPYGPRPSAEDTGQLGEALNLGPNGSGTQNHEERKTMPGPTAVFANPTTRAKAITALAGGAKTGEVARMVQCSRYTVYKFRTQEEIKEEIDAQAQALMAAVPLAVDLKIRTMTAGDMALERELNDDGMRTDDNYKQIEARRANDIKLITQANESGTQLTQMVGITPSHTSSLVINNLVLGDSNALSPVLSKLLCGPEIDVTPEGEDEE